MERGAIARTWQAADVPAELAALRPDANATVLEHERLPFVSHPCEWSPLMLCDAALHTLEMQQLALAEGLILKDAAPTNIVFRGSRPVFVDFLSFVEREPGEYLWRARHQFDACFLLPLLLNIEAGIPDRLDAAGFPARSLARAGAAHPGNQVLAQARLDRRSRLARGMLSRKRLGHGRHACRRRRKLDNDARARFTLEHQTSGAASQSSRSALATGGGASRWAAYTTSRAHYSAADLDEKLAFVRQAAGDRRPARSVLDLGANTGEFSELAAAKARVVAVDIDEQSVSGIAERARSRSLDIHPLVGNLAQPTPAAGWKNAETRSLLDRLTQAADLVLVLALMHHLRITGGIPFAEIVDCWRPHAPARGFELVPPTDTMFAAMARGREPLYTDCEPARAEAAHGGTLQQSCGARQLENGRVLLLLEKR